MERIEKLKLEVEELKQQVKELEGRAIPAPLSQAYNDSFEASQAYRQALKQLSTLNLQFVWEAEEKAKAPVFDWARQIFQAMLKNSQFNPQSMEVKTSKVKFNAEKQSKKLRRPRATL